MRSSSHFDGLGMPALACALVDTTARLSAQHNVFDAPLTDEALRLLASWHSQ
jgi:hypothetical protein